MSGGMTVDLSGRTAVVSGAADGIGRGIADLLAGSGATVFGVDVQPVRAGTPVWDASVLDLTDRPAAGRWVAEVEERSGGPVDILVNCAGGWAGRVPAPLEDVTDEDWDAVVGANLDTAFGLSRAVVPGMKKQGSGRIIMITSGAGTRVSPNDLVPYTAAKHAATGLTRQLARQVGPFGITVNAVAPGLVLSSAEVTRNWANAPEERRAGAVESVFVRRLGTPADIAGAVAFLASDAASWISGQVLDVNGGR